MSTSSTPYVATLTLRSGAIEIAGASQSDFSPRHLVHIAADTRLQARSFAQGHLVSSGAGGRDE